MGALKYPPFPLILTTLLAAAAQQASVAVPNGEIFEFTLQALGNAASNTLSLLINGDTAATGYQQNMASNSSTNMVFATNADTAAIGAAAGSGDVIAFSGKITRLYDGTNTTFAIHYAGTIANAYSSGVNRVQKTGDIPLSAVALRGSQATGLKAGSYLSVRKIR